MKTGRKKIYTIPFRCIRCRKVIGIKNKESKIKVIKSYVTVCIKCFEKGF